MSSDDADDWIAFNIARFCSRRQGTRCVGNTPGSLTRAGKVVKSRPFLGEGGRLTRLLGVTGTSLGWCCSFEGEARGVKGGRTREGVDGSCTAFTVKSGEAGLGRECLEGVEGTLWTEAALSFKLVVGDAQAALALSAMALGVVISTQSITSRDGPGRGPGVDGGWNDRLSSSASTSRDEFEMGVASGMSCCCLLRVTRLGDALSSEALRLGGILEVSKDA